MFHSIWRLLPPWLIFDKSNFLTQFYFQFRIPSIFVPCTVRNHYKNVIFLVASKSENNQGDTQPPGFIQAT